MEFLKEGGLISWPELGEHKERHAAPSNNPSLHPITLSASKFVLFDRFHQENSSNPYDALHRLDACRELQNQVNTSVCEQQNKELSKFRYSLYNMSPANFLLAITHISLMRNKRAMMGTKKDLEKELGCELEVDEETGMWKEQGTKLVTIPPLLRDRGTLSLAGSKSTSTKPTQPIGQQHGQRIGFLNTKEKNILRISNQWFTAGIINYYASLRLRHKGISYQPAERSQRKFEPVQGVMLQVINVNQSHWILLHCQATSPTVVRVYDPMVKKLRSAAVAVNKEVEVAAQQLTNDRVENIHVMDCQQQEDTYSCGPLCLGFLWALSGGEDPNKFYFVPTAIRKTLLQITEDITQLDTALGRQLQKRDPVSKPLCVVKIRDVIEVR